MKLPSPRWWLAGAAIALAAFLVVTFGSLMAKARNQKKLLDELESLPGAGVLGAVRNSQWEEWTPTIFQEYLPYEEVGVVIFERDSLHTALKICRQLEVVRSISLTEVKPSDEQWQSLADMRLLSLSLRDTPITERHLETLLQNMQLSELEITNAPLSDKCLDFISKQSKLTTLRLAQTPLTHQAITSFAAKHPDIKITWNPPITPQQVEIYAKLQALQVTIRRGGVDIDPNPPWWATIPKATPEIMNLLMELQANIATVEVVEWNQESIELLRSLPGLVIVNFAGSVNRFAVESLLNSPSVEEVSFSFKGLPPEDIIDLTSRYGTQKRILNNDPKLPLDED